jgi:hypothetical protein
MPSLRATDSADDSSVRSAAQDTDRHFVALAERRLHASRERADGRRLQVRMIDLVNQALRLRDTEVRQQQRCQRRYRTALIRLTKHRAKRRAANPVPASLVT